MSGHVYVAGSGYGGTQGTNFITIKCADTNPPVSVGAESDPTPREYALVQNYPNPFNPTTIVSYHLPAVSDIRIVVYDLLGREVAVLANERKAPGTYTVTFDARDLASGAYFYRLTAENFVQAQKMIVVR